MARHESRNDLRLQREDQLTAGSRVRHHGPKRGLRRFLNAKIEFAGTRASRGAGVAVGERQSLRQRSHWKPAEIIVKCKKRARLRLAALLTKTACFPAKYEEIGAANYAAVDPVVAGSSPVALAVLLRSATVRYDAKIHINGPVSNSRRERIGSPDEGINILGSSGLDG